MLVYQVHYFVVIDDGSLTDDMLYEIINNITKSVLAKEKSSTTIHVKGLL